MDGESYKPLAIFNLGEGKLELPQVKAEGEAKFLEICPLICFCKEKTIGVVGPFTH